MCVKYYYERIAILAVICAQLSNYMLLFEKEMLMVFYFVAGVEIPYMWDLASA